LASQEEHFYCTEGMPSTMQIPDTINMFEVLISPKLTVMIFSNHEVRHIYTDGRNHPSSKELWPTPEGDSVGHWQDGTLVIDTISTSAQVMQLKPVEFDPGNVVPVSVLNTPTSDQLHIIERITLLKGAILEDQMTVEDPVAFAHPYKGVFTFKRLTDLNRMVYEDCDEGCDDRTDGARPKEINTRIAEACITDDARRPPRSGSGHCLSQHRADFSVDDDIRLAVHVGRLAVDNNERGAVRLRHHR
jgi:hypothetical protein